MQVTDSGWGYFEENDMRGNSEGSVFTSPECKARVVLERNLEDAKAKA